MDYMNLGAIRANMESSGVKAKHALSYDETYERVSQIIEEDQVAKIRETSKSTNAEKTEKTKAYYRENFEFYYQLIKNTLLSNGIKTYKVIEEKAVEMSYDEVSREIASGYVGFDCLEDAMNDPQITDIYVISWNNIFVEKNGKNEVYQKRFRNPQSYKNFIERILREAGKQLDSGENKIVDFELYGNRGNVINDMIAAKGICLTMRKHSESPIQLPTMIENQLMTKEIADMLGITIEGETNMIYAGITGSGKTTTIRALLDHYIPPLKKRALVLEDTPELFLKNPHTVDLTTFPTDDLKTNITLRDLNISALRMKPKYIIVGEVRGAEAEAAVEGMETGHSTIFSMHGGNVWNIIDRLVTKYLMQMPTLGIEVVERIIGSSINFVCIQDDVPGIGRRLTSVHEISYDFDKRTVTATPIVQFDFKTNDWAWLNCLSENVLNTMTRRGVSFERVEELNNGIRSRIKSNLAA